LWLYSFAGTPPWPPGGTTEKRKRAFGVCSRVRPFLGLNKQLDLQTWFTLLGRHMAEEEGWYAERRSFQAAFIATILVLGIAGLILIWRLARNKVRHYGLALTGGIFLGCFIVIRAASFHYVDQMLGMKFNNVPLNCLLELGGIACLAAGAFQSSRLELRAST